MLFLFLCPLGFPLLTILAWLWLLQRSQNHLTQSCQALGFPAVSEVKQGLLSTSAGKEKIKPRCGDLPALQTWVLQNMDFSYTAENKPCSNMTVLQDFLWQAVSTINRDPCTSDLTLRQFLHQPRSYS